MSDVVVQSWRPGTAERYGLDYEALSADNPRLIHCSITGFGPIHHLGDLPGLEGVVAAKAGLWLGLDEISGAALPNRRANRPVFKVVPVNGYAAAQLAVQGIVGALIERFSSGRGQRVATSLLQGSLSLAMRVGLKRSDDSVDSRPNTASTLHRGIALTFLTAECADGMWIQMCARQDHHFRNWLRAMDIESLLSEPRFSGAPLGIARSEDIDDLERILRSRMGTRSRQEWMRLFTEEYDVGADPFLTPTEFVDHPQVRANGLVVEVGDSQLGRTLQPAPIAQVDGITPSLGSAPQIGEHGAARWSSVSSLAEKGSGSDVRATPSRSSAGPLAGALILEFAYFIAAPLGATLLAELGARVIKVEPPDGDPFRRTGTEFAHMVHGKESIAVDLKSIDGRSILHKLVQRAHALVHSFRPGVAERIGLDFASLSRINPSLVYVYAGAYGSRGPQAHRASFHSTPNALVGAGLAQAGEGNPPVDDSWPDPVAAHGVASAMALGLLHRQLSGIGAYMETNMLLSASYAYSDQVVAFDGRPAPPIVDAGQHGLGSSYRLYRAMQGWLFVGTTTLEAWTQFVGAIGRPDLSDLFEEPGIPTDGALARVIEDILKTRSARDWEKDLRAKGIAAVQADGAGLPQFLLENRLLSPASHSDFGNYWKMPAKVDFSRSQSTVGDAASLGEHTIPVLRELQYTDGEIARLLELGVVHSSPARMPADIRFGDVAPGLIAQ
jgi:crotonobetainyl-CoA:carnitine CoA-transferase CaiB-like acyl-CoA transferase